MIESKEVKVFEERLYCDNCGEEMQLSDGCTLLSNPPKYAYICPKCNNTEIISEIYPKIRYKEI